MRYYYDDPIKAVYMMREFGFDYEGSEGSLKIDAEFYPSGEISYSKYGFEPHGHADIDPDCYELLKPRVGDIGVSESGEVGKYNGRDWLQAEGCNDSGGGYYMDKCVTIIQRDNKVWFAPKIEKND